MITPEELEIMIWDRTLPKSLRLEIHELTRTVRISDEELMEYAPKGYHGLVEIRWIEALKDLRDRYEGLGKYAPAQPAAAPHPEPVTK